jgi:Protein of unknown function (DUF1186)
VLQETARQGREGRLTKGNAHVFALLLLAEFKAQEALPALLEVISLPGDMAELLFDDAITENLPRVLATLAADRIEALDSLIENAELNSYVRWAGSRAIGYLVQDGKLSRASAVQRLQSHLRAAIDKQDSWQATVLDCDLCYLNPLEAKAEIDEAFAKPMSPTPSPPPAPFTTPRRTSGATTRALAAAARNSKSVACGRAATANLPQAAITARR